MIGSTLEVGRRYRCTMRVVCGRLHPGAVIRPEPANGTRICPSGSMKTSRTGAGHDAIYQLAALTVDARLALADG